MRKVILPVTGLSQWDAGIDERLRTSACGPTTIRTIFDYHGETDVAIDQLYRSLGTTRIGLFTWRLMRNFRRLSDGRLRAHRIRSVEEVKSELLAGRPLAMKFDRYFTFRWRKKSVFAYHWVPLVGFEETEGDLLLYIHDNGGRNRPSRLQKVSYEANRSILTFIGIRTEKK